MPALLLLLAALLLLLSAFGHEISSLVRLRSRSGGLRPPALYYPSRDETRLGGVSIKPGRPGGRRRLLGGAGGQEG